MRFHPSTGAARGRRRADLQASGFAAIAATHVDRQALRTSSLTDPLGEWQRCPAAAPQAMGVQFVVVRVQTSDVAEVDHA